MKKTALILLAVLTAAQLLIPASMIFKHERILRTGTLYRFKTRPIDPADPFQGRYVRLSFENDFIPGTNENAPEPNYRERVFVTLGSDADGFCELKTWSRIKPEEGNFLKLACTGPARIWNSQTNIYKGIRFDLPFNRFYMDENKAPRAENLVREGSRTTNCWAAVRVLNGAALVEDVFVEGASIRELAGQATQ